MIICGVGKFLRILCNILNDFFYSIPKASFHNFTDVCVLGRTENFTPIFFS